MLESKTLRTQLQFRKLEQVTHKHLVRWQCPRCGYAIEHLVWPNTTTPLTCPARQCQQRFQIVGDLVFTADPL